MRGGWACQECAKEHGLYDGHGFSAGGWCGVGGHSTKDRIEYFPDAITETSCVAKESAATHTTMQMDLF